MWGFFLNTYFKGVGSHRQPKELCQPSTYLPQKSDGRKPRLWSSRATVVIQAKSTRTMLMDAWGTVPAPVFSSGVVRHRQDLMSTWFPCLVLGFAFFFFFVAFVSNIPLCLGFLGDFLSLISRGTLWP